MRRDERIYFSWWLIVCAAFIIAAAIGACGKAPTMPTPIPGVSPSPIPQDTFPGRLRVEGENFVAGGKTVKLFGGVVCCEDYPINGWPWISESYISLISENGGNYVHIRLGPFTARGERPEFVAYEDAGGGRVNLDVWNDAFWQALTQKLAFARSKGVYVEVDLIDAWVLERPEISPWNKANNINGVNELYDSCVVLAQPPTPLQKRWLRKIIEVTRGFDNVIYQISNESDRRNCGGLLSEDWELGIIELFRQEHPSALLGTNSGLSAVEDAADYIQVHTSFAIPTRGKPVMVNEWGDRLTPEDYRDEIRKALQYGSSFHYWRGEHTQEEFIRSMGYLRSLRDTINAGNIGRTN